MPEKKYFYEKNPILKSDINITFEQLLDMDTPIFKVWVKNHGGNCIQGSTKYESIVKLFNRLYGYEKKYTLMELRI